MLQMGRGINEETGAEAVTEGNPSPQIPGRRVGEGREGQRCVRGRPSRGFCAFPMSGTYWTLHACSVRGSGPELNGNCTLERGKDPLPGSVSAFSPRELKSIPYFLWNTRGLYPYVRRMGCISDV